MKIQQHQWIKSKWEKEISNDLHPQLCLIFGSRFTIEKESSMAIDKLKLAYPETKVVSVSTAGNILDDQTGR